MREDNNILHLAVRKFDAFEAAVKRQWAAYCRETGCKMQLNAVPMDLPELHTSLFTDQGLKMGQWDIAQISADWMRQAIDQSALQSISEFVTHPEFFDDWPLSLKRSQTYLGRYYALPFHDGPECLIYRKDLFEDNRHRENFSRLHGYALAPPVNWSSYLDIACYFQENVTGLYGTALAAFPDSHNAVYDFCIHIWTRGGDFLLPDGKINFLQPAVTDGMTYYRQLAKAPRALHPESKSMDSVALGNAFSEGKVAMMINWFGFAAYAQTTPSALNQDSIGVAPIPCAANCQPVSPNSYWLYGIGAGSKNKTVAFDFIRFATRPENDIEITLNGAVGCRKSTWLSQEVNQKIPFFHALEDLHEYARELPQTKQWPAAAKIIDEIMVQVTQTDLPISDILEGAQQKINLLF